MRDAFSKVRARLPFFVSGVALILCIVSGYLYQQNQSFKKANRKLIIENDSIISVNIELKRELRDTKPALGKGKPINFKGN